jgi:hypothetical protein
MLNFNIARVLKNEWGTFGVFAVEDTPFANTLEPIMPIPAGFYFAKYCWHPEHGWKYEYQNVPGHTGILIHIGNWVQDTKDCTLPGKFIDKIWKGVKNPFTWQWGVGNSAVALNEFMGYAKGLDISIKITESFYDLSKMGAIT